MHAGCEGCVLLSKTCHQAFTGPDLATWVRGNLSSRTYCYFPAAGLQYSGHFQHPPISCNWAQLSNHASNVRVASFCVLPGACGSWWEGGGPPPHPCPLLLLPRKAGWAVLGPCCSTPLCTFSTGTTRPPGREPPWPPPILGVGNQKKIFPASESACM